MREGSNRLGQQAMAVRGALLRAARRAAAFPHAPALGSLLLAMLALIQVAVQPASAVGAGGPPAPIPKLFLVLIALATTLPLGAFWSQPRTAAVVITIADALSLGLVHAFTAAGLAAVLIAVYRLSYYGAQLLAAGIAALFLVLALAANTGHNARMVPILLAAAVPMTTWAGYAASARGELVVRSAQSEAIAGTLLEHTARGERARISRELHDVVAHHISMIAVQAETARLTTPGMPAAGAQRLSTIGDTARSALTEMRRLLGVLREDTSAELTLRQPQPGLDQLNELLDEARDAAGSGTRLIISGWLTALDPGVELAAYRIVQEALTNARRHAPGAAVDVEVRYEGNALCLRIRDNGPGPPAEQGPGGDRLPPGNRLPGGGGLPSGHGLLGMRERAAAVGGTLRTGPAPGGGFLVEASLPAKAEQDVA